ncbi:MAG: ribbon-helix-helix domain-containing protein [Nitrospiraceae bacterium]|nr:ribbon-helix-helix domain-containing protein [Nitrospiraceae bacterium]
MEHSKVRPLIKNKTKMITMRINPDLLDRLDEALKKDKQYASRNDFIEDCILRYLESKGKL